MDTKTAIKFGLHLRPEYASANLKLIHKKASEDLKNLCKKILEIPKEEFYKKNFHLYLYGPYRAGKTWFFHAVMNYLYLKFGENSMYFITSPNLLEYFRNRKMYDDEFTWVQYLSNKRFLVIDDIGQEYRGSNTGFAETYLEQFIRWRINNGFITYLGGNGNVNELIKVYGGSFGELIDSEFVTFDIENSPNMGKIILQEKLDGKNQH